MSNIYTDPPQSRNEAIIKSTIDGTEYTAPPQSRMEDLLLELKEAIEQGGGGGTKDYSQLSNKPSINDVTLIGNKTSSDLSLASANELASKADLTDLAPAFSTATAYTVGQYVSYDGNIYKCTSAHSAGAWVAGDFTLVAVGSELESKQDATDSNLQTTDKTVVGAVNELKGGSIKVFEVPYSDFAWDGEKKRFYCTPSGAPSRNRIVGSSVMPDNGAAIMGLFINTQGVYYVTGYIVSHGESIEDAYQFKCFVYYI